MQPIKVRKPYDAVFYDAELDMINLKCENIYIYRDVKKFFENHEGMFNLEATQDLIIANNYKNRVNKKINVIRKILETQITKEV
jgi:butyrate kinase